MHKGFLFVSTRLGKNILQIRKTRKITQEELGLVAWVSPNYISNLERGRVNPSLRMLRKICRRLHVRMRDLFEGI